MSPAISVVMPVLNMAAFLPEAIESILGQTFGDLELIVVDDGSTDASPAIAADYAARDRRVRPMQLKRDPRITSGCRAANAAIAQADGGFIARLDADDIAMPERLAVQMEFMREANLDLCGGQAVYFGESEGEFWFPETQQAILYELLFRIPIMHSTMTAATPLLRRAPYDERITAEDYELQVRLAFAARMGNSHRVLARHRVHPGQGHLIHRQSTMADWWRYRFLHFFRLFPDASITDFSVLNRVATKTPLDSIEELALAGRWLVRLSRVAETRLRRRMTERWRDACGRMTPDAKLEPMAQRFAEQIEAAP